MLLTADRQSNGVHRNSRKPWQKREWCIPEIDADYVAAMEDVLDLYQKPYDPQRPVVCFDESQVQLIAELREPIDARLCSTLRYDVEYKRNGVRRLAADVRTAVWHSRGIGD